MNKQLMALWATFHVQLGDKEMNKTTLSVSSGTCQKTWTAVDKEMCQVK